MTPHTDALNYSSACPQAFRGKDSLASVPVPFSFPELEVPLIMLHLDFRPLISLDLISAHQRRRFMYWLIDSDRAVTTYTFYLIGELGIFPKYVLLQ